MKKTWEYCSIVLAAVLFAFNYYIFIQTNSFAPAGLNGIATMIQYKTGFSISYMSLLINIPPPTSSWSTRPTAISSTSNPAENRGVNHNKIM